MLHFQQVSDLLGIEVEQLRALNPQYKRDIIPGNTKPSVLVLPDEFTKNTLASRSKSSLPLYFCVSQPKPIKHNEGVSKFES